MSLSPLDIANHEFSRSLRGYDPAEVRAFLERVSDELHALQTRVTELTERNAGNEAKLDSFREMEKSLRDSVVLAQDNISASRSQIEHEREQMLREARLQADEIKLAVEREIMALREDLRGLKLHRDAYVKRFRFLLKSQVELLDLLESETHETSDDRTENPSR